MIRIQQYFSDTLNSLDAVIIGVTLMINIIYTFYDFQGLNNIPRLAVLFRSLRLIILMRVFHLAYQKRHLESLTRRMVSGNKRRYRRDGFDLDLTYVTDRIIAMSFPSSGKQSFYRNPIKAIHLDIFPIHLDIFQVFEKWRTGTMVCAYLLASEIFTTAEESLHHFGKCRTDITTSSKFQGIETPSQNRYVGYFAKVKNDYHWDLPPIKFLFLKSIVIYSIHGKVCDLKLQVIMHKELVFFCSFSKNCRMYYDAETNRVIINPINCPYLCDDVKMKFFSSGLQRYYDNCSFYFWFNTSFIQNQRLYLPRSELDNPHKSKTWHIYQRDFAVELYFE
ncbi:phosphatidylinositol 3,4,5-trisphosphate 3-phosphatase TPTE2-like [Orycteropus afer afer]|uniref:Phosphatidylinositol 3,4,5-trisphosphate 3-phosphatase TPTE2-like n=1 Tax=Orycteropus afer afer TaxID=1230840 RepID=A0A8B7A660_ORYAF|nr:phosphatidylinositol 3,4,5-trisphosphate 3-phosphatase TPTE2-like [Orycteropus afer afer]